MDSHFSRVSLLAAEPELGRFLTREERAAAARASVPVLTLARGPLEMSPILLEARAFGGLVLEGMIFSRFLAGGQVAIQVIGPGDAVGAPERWRSSVVCEGACTVLAATKVAVLGDEVLLAVRRWPRIMAGLYVRMSEQSQRVKSQLAICQLPRVDQRLLAIMWLLAESWGQVTALGTRLPLNLTHDALGGLIGARRPTVTLALGELAQRGAIVRQDRGWLLLERPVESPPAVRAPATFDVMPPDAPSAWPSEAATARRPPLEEDRPAPAHAGTGGRGPYRRA